jgi:cytochrome c-type biogenesis protein CcmH/NrfG
MRRLHLDDLDVLIPLKQKQQQALLRTPAPRDSTVHAQYSTSTTRISRQSLEGIVILLAAQYLQIDATRETAAAYSSGERAPLLYLSSGRCEGGKGVEGWGGIIL